MVRVRFRVGIRIRARGRGRVRVRVRVVRVAVAGELALVALDALAHHRRHHLQIEVDLG